MTAIQAREPARTPADAQSAGSRQTTPNLADLIVLMIVWLGLSAATGIAAALMASIGRDPTWCLGVMALGWTVVHTRGLPAKNRGGTR